MFHLFIKNAHIEKVNPFSFYKYIEHLKSSQILAIHQKLIYWEFDGFLDRNDEVKR